MPVFEPEEYASRLSKLKGIIRTKSIDLVLISYPRDIYYYTGYFLGCKASKNRKKYKRNRVDQACGKIMAKIPEILLSRFHSGMTELEMSVIIEDYFRSEGLGYNCSRQDGINFGFGVFSAGINSMSPTRFDGICSGKGLSPAMPFGAGQARQPCNRGIFGNATSLSRKCHGIPHMKGR